MTVFKTSIKQQSIIIGTDEDCLYIFTFKNIFFYVFEMIFINAELKIKLIMK